MFVEAAAFNTLLSFSMNTRARPTLKLGSQNQTGESSGPFRCWWYYLELGWEIEDFQLVAAIDVNTLPAKQETVQYTLTLWQLLVASWGSCSHSVMRQELRHANMQHANSPIIVLWYPTVLFKFTYPLSFFSHELIYIHYVRSINFFGLILQCHNIHTIDFNDIYNLVETCVYIFLKRIVVGLLESANWCILAAQRFFKEVVGKKIRILC